MLDVSERLMLARVCVCVEEGVVDVCEGPISIVSHQRGG